MDKSNYFVEKFDSANESFMNTDGGFEDFADYSDEMDFDAQSMLNASGNTGGKSQPYIIVIANTTTNDVTNAVLLNASQTIATAGAVSGLSISSNIPGITYTDILYGTIYQPFNVGVTRLQSTSQTQVTQTVTITSKDINGNSAAKPFIPLIDNYQYQQNQVDIPYEYVVTALTSITIARILASTTLYLYLFPSMKVSQIAQLTTGKQISAYKNPQVNKSLAAKK
jgi:hypothetical protein